MSIAPDCIHMAPKERTVEVDSELFEDSIPEYYTDETVPIELTAFDDKLYVDFPDWSRVEQKRESDLHENVIERLTDDRNLPLNARDETKTSQFLLKAESMFRAMVTYERSSELDSGEVKPMLRFYGSCDEQTHRNDIVYTRRYNQLDELGHLKVVEAFASTLADHIDTPYWEGYRDGSGDDWSDVAFKCFSRHWNGDAELLLDVGEYLVSEGIAISERTNTAFPIPHWGTTNGGNYVCTIAAREAATCSKCGSELTETRTCTSSSNSTTKANRYKCDPEKGGCGHSFNGITTG
jgi:hypothetical protein